MYLWSFPEEISSVQRDGESDPIKIQLNDTYILKVNKL